MTRQRPAWRKKHDESFRHPPTRVDKLAYQNCPYFRHKRSYVTKRVAEQAAAKYQARTPGRRLAPYLCNRCWDWHLYTVKETR